MKVLWVSNSSLPNIALDMDETPVNVEGWKIKISEEMQHDSNIELIVCFPNLNIDKVVSGKVDKIKYYAIPNNNRRKTKYNIDDEYYFMDIVNKENPDVIHIWGSEFPHSLAMAKVCKKMNCIEKVVVSVQGLVSVYASHYDLKLPKKMLLTYHPLDLLYSHSIKMGIKQYLKRGIYEQELFRIVSNVIGRTDWDLACTKWINKERNYYFCNETLRNDFYSGVWEYNNCNKHTIFLSQAYYPIKGFHCFLDALKLLVDEFPDIRVRVGGMNFLERNTLKKRFLPNSYANYIRKRLVKEGLGKHVEFLGSLTSAQMKNEYLKCNVFVSPSLIENSPNSVGEAMILGVPTISSDVGGVKNLLEHGKEGMIYPVDEPYMLAYYIRKIFINKVFSNEISNNARIKALTTHNHINNYDQLIRIYEQIMSSKKRKGVIE